MQGFKVFSVVINKLKLARIGGLAVSAFSSFGVVLLQGAIIDLGEVKRSYGGASTGSE